MLKLINFVEWARLNSVFLNFIDSSLLFWILTSLFFGFLVLLLELKLPFKYYWNIPYQLLHSVLISLGLARKRPVWGYCLDREDKRIIPVAAIELIDAHTKKVVSLTYSNRLGQYGFGAVGGGQYYLRAIKNYYQTPSILDPENVQLIEIKESFSLPVKISALGQSAPQVNLELQPIEKFDPKNPKTIIKRYSKTFLFALGNGFLSLAVAGSFIAWAITQSLVFGLLLAVGVVLLFIKIYVLETVRQITAF